MNRLNTSPNSTETNLLPLWLSWRPLIFVAICSHDFTQKAPESHPTHDILRSESLLHHKNIWKSTLQWLQNSKHSFKLNDVQNLLPGKLEQNRELGPEFLKLLLWAQTASFRSWRPTTVRILKYKNAIKCLGNDSVRKLMWQNGINQELNAIWMWKNSQRDDGHIL